MEDFPNTIVFWNSEDYPIPCGAHLSSAMRNIEEALNRKGFHGCVDIQAYGDHLNQVELRKAQITYFEPETSRGLSSAVSRMPIDMIQDAATSAEPPTFMVIAKHPEREWHRVLQCLQSRNHTVLVLEPPDDTAFDDVESLVQCTRVPQILEHRSKIQDFSEPLTHAKGKKTVVFWDVVDCPFPTRCSDADEIFSKIDKALSPWGETSIWAYVDEGNDGPWSGECLRDKTWDSRIYFLPGGASRPERMLNDIHLLFSLNSQAGRYTTKLVGVSDQITDDTYFFDRLESYSDSCFVFLVTPTRNINDPDSTDWPQLLIDEAYFFEPSPETHEEDAQVFWNLEDYPIPDGFRLPSFRRNIEKALKRMGFGGHTYFQAYGDRLNHGRAALRKARVEYFLPEGGDYSAVSRVPLDMIMHAATTGPSTFLIIAKQSPEREWRRVLPCLKSRNHTAIVVDDTARSLKSVVKRIRVLDEEKPISKSSKIQDFSEPITHAKGDNTAVFWDVVDCPFPPLCSDPDEIYRRIEETLRGSGCTAEISIWAYVDEDNDGPWSAKMILVSDQVREGTDLFRTYQDLNGTSGFRVCLVTPTRDVNKAESPEWPRLLLAETATLFGSKSQLKEHAAEEVIQVFWNSDDYPFPDNYDFCSIVLSIDEDLEEMGFNGIPEIWAYGDYPHDGIERLSKTGIKYHLSESSRGDCSAMPLDMLLCAATRGPSKFLVIAKQRPEGELQRVQQCLKSRNHTLVLVDDTAQEWSILSLADCTQVLGGGELSQFLREKMPISNTRILISGEHTAVFWNMEDVPFPHYSDPDTIYCRMVTSLGERGVHCTGEVSIWAYVDEKEESRYLRDKTWDSRIYFLPGGVSGRNRMLNDILLWHMDYSNEHSDPPQLIVVSDYVYSPSCSRMWDYLQSTCNYRVRFVTSRPGHVACNESESSEPISVSCTHLFK
ncbi:unnamed protein product [Thlaspi arvense]|uniref:NYN domain-containing protein n=1 Tax=Thlaspi arvense TaxID=13288 RepID=A0AAU9SS79_THLAR|nr:unnamed protein product [Thlaspi arvense]